MLDSLEINGFRRFEQYAAANLGRVNLFVGRNSSGKTTILEAAQILLEPDTAWAVCESPRRRGEMYVPPNQDAPGRYADVSHLFHGHICELGQRFDILGVEAGDQISMTCQVDDVGEERARAGFAEFDLIDSWLDIRHSKDIDGRSSHVPLMRSGAVPVNEVPRRRGKTGSEERPVTFIKGETPNAERIRELWDEIVLTDEEASVTESLRILEPRIEKVAFRGHGSFSEGLLRLRGVEKRLPLGTLGDGVSHLLALSVAVSRSRRGFVMIDEIDTGLHHSVMADMWRVLIATAERLDVQVFATTHSLDCVRALAWLFSQEPALASVVRLHRVDDEQGSTVVYSPEEILTAARHHVELRGW